MGFSGDRARASRRLRWMGLGLCGLSLVPSALLPVTPALAAADDVAVEARTPVGEAWEHSLKDAWWTGPMLASTAETLPHGHFYTEPYMFDVISGGKHHPGWTAYLQYGLRDDFTVGLLPAVAFGTEAPDRRPMIGDIELLSQFRLTHFTAKHRVPTIALVLQERLPTGRYDRLDRPAQGQGSGSFATEIGLNAQYYFRLPNGRLLRARINFLERFPSSAEVHGRSVYGTSDGFRGRARPGRTTTLGVAAEYSLTRNWVLALDIFHSTSRRTIVSGTAGADAPLETTILPGSSSIAVAPAVEYNWSALGGVLAGVRFIRRGRNTPASVTPAIAFSRSW